MASDTPANSEFIDMIQQAAAAKDARATGIRQVAITTVGGVGGVCLLFRWPIVAAALFVALLVQTTRVWSTRRDLFVAGVAVLSGMALELTATSAGLWRYTHATFEDLPAWVPVLWPVYMIGLPRLAEIVVPGPPSPLARASVAAPLGLLSIVGVIASLGFFGNTQPGSVTIALWVCSAMAFAVTPSRRSLVVLLTSAAFGLACEFLPVRLGIWMYPAFGISGMPPWLAPGYALFGLGTVHLGQGVEGLLPNRR